MNINQTELIELLSKRTGLGKEGVGNVIDSVCMFEWNEEEWEQYFSYHME